jgi:hypothetical protein
MLEWADLFAAAGTEMKRAANKAAKRGILEHIKISRVAVN